MSHRAAATVASDAHPRPTDCRCAMRTRPKVSSALPVRKYGLCNLIEATSANTEPISSHATALDANASTGPRHDASMAARSAADFARSCGVVRYAGVAGMCGEILTLEADPNAKSILLNPNFNQLGVATDLGSGNYWAIVLARIEPPGTN